MRTRRLTLFVAALMTTAGLSAQTIIDIEAGGGPGPVAPYYAPQFVEIEVGDMVRWTNSGGTHNVDGTTETFPDNPEGFTSGEPSNDLWVFTHTFTIPGVYGFECSAYDHNLTQFGTVTVTDPTVGVPEFPDLEVSLYPNPTNDILRVVADRPVDQLAIYTLDMKKVVGSDQDRLPASTMEIQVGELARGQYFVSIQIGEERAIRTIMID